MQLQDLCDNLPSMVEAHAIDRGDATYSVSRTLAGSGGRRFVEKGGENGLTSAESCIWGLTVKVGGL